jgi:hypothetical protein
MEELAKLILSAPALNVALLCVVIALVVILRRERVKIKNGNGQERPTLDSAFIRRSEEHWRKSHEHASEIGIAMLRLDRMERETVPRIERDLSRIDDKVDQVSPRLATLEAIVSGLVDGVKGVRDTVKENHQQVTGLIRDVLDKLQK